MCLLFLPVACLICAGCTPAVVGGGAAGGYKVATDERSAGDMVDDVGITAKVKSDLIAEKTIKARNIDVDTINGVVILSGFVDSQKEIDRAVALARGVPGVRQVKNELRIGSRTVGQAFDDKVLGTRIKARLVDEPGIRSLNIDVDVYAGMVTLTGIVQSQEQKKTVFAIVRSVDGGRGIVDNLQIGK
ncbi:BON domain-containing protein [Thiovibrio sp. JS02]